MESSRKIARAGLIAGLYVTLSLIVFPVSSGAVQLRISEGLTILALIYPESIFALTVGCALSNLITSCAPWDVVLGSLVTLLSAFCTFRVGKLIKKTTPKIILGGVFPVLFNATILPLVWILCYGNLEYMYLVQVLLLFIGQSVSVYAVGTPVYLAVRKLRKKGTRFLL